MSMRSSMLCGVVRTFALLLFQSVKAGQGNDGGESSGQAYCIPLI